MSSARQWISQMTAGLMPRRLMVSHQQDGLVLEYKISKEILPDTTDPLLSKIVWRQAMSEIKKISADKRVWTVLGVTSLEIIPAKADKIVKVLVRIAVKVADSDKELNELFGKMLGKEFIFSDNPELEYVFAGEKANTSPENNNDGSTVIKLKI